MKPFTKKLVLENGREFLGYGYGANVERVCEIVFNTSVVGYQEILSDPSNIDQIVVMAYPLIGNYGIIESDFIGETKLSGYVVREWCEAPSNFRCDGDIDEYLKKEGIVGICDVDTREITQHIRENGVMKAKIVTDLADVEKVVEDFDYSNDSIKALKEEILNAKDEEECIE